ncbi:pectinesterase family protein [Flavobacterium seoulense]|uniref:Pectinesterase n=1 Tax=Flavobacterium seoulense TaxID=1492738 RepID=A0A066WJN5_9FLAO|nr:pectinesterase family protein [Flavobacterium seoulense]KDN54232.1 pectinesterase [Flavobacterium seoulense]
MRNILLFLFFAFSNCIEAQSKIDSNKKITVAQDGSGDYKTIGDAIEAANTDNGVVVIYIKNGIYKEKLVILSSKKGLELQGENKDKTIITNDDYSGKLNPNSKRNFGTSDSYTLLVRADDVKISNLTIENSWCDKGQAVSLHVKGTRFAIKNSRILGCQDTLLTDGDGTYQYYENCYIDGTTDFIFGPATAVFENCIINSKKDSYITAASTPENLEFGYVFLNCKLIADANVTKVFLGRPWRPFAKTVFLGCNLGSHILLEGWNPWVDERFPDKTKTTYYAEYKNKGKGSKTNKRVAWSHQLSKEEAKKYILKNIFPKDDFWKKI